MPSLNYSPTPFQQVDYKATINEELKADKELNAFFLAHGFVEAYLREWLFITGNPMGTSSKHKLSKKITDDIERLSFRNALTIHAVLGNIDNELYGKMSKFNDWRNTLAHELIRVDLRNEKNRKKIRNMVKFGITLCDEVFRLYKNNLDIEAKIIEEEAKADEMGMRLEK